MFAADQLVFQNRGFTVHKNENVWALQFLTNIWPREPSDTVSFDPPLKKMT